MVVLASVSPIFAIRRNMDMESNFEAAKDDKTIKDHNQTCMQGLAVVSCIGRVASPSVFPLADANDETRVCVASRQGLASLLVGQPDL